MDEKSAFLVGVGHEKGVACNGVKDQHHHPCGTDCPKSVSQATEKRFEAGTVILWISKDPHGGIKPQLGGADRDHRNAANQKHQICQKYVSYKCQHPHQRRIVSKQSFQTDSLLLLHDISVYIMQQKKSRNRLSPGMSILKIDKES